MQDIKKTNVLLISIYFPPLQHIASNRIYSFAKYLDKDKYNVFVLTYKNNYNYDDINIPLVNVIREKNQFIFKRASFNNNDGKVTHMFKGFYNILLNKTGIDPYTGWIKQCTKTAKKLIEEKNINIIISSYGPISPHIVALHLKETYGSRINWIADMRDEFPTNNSLIFMGRNHSKRMHSIEKKILLYCDALTSVSKPILESFESMSSNNNCIFKEIRNGYDFEIKKKKIKQKDIFKILYAGSFYGDIKPGKFFRVLEDLNSNINFCLQIIGSNKNTFRIPNTIKDKVIIREKVPYDQAIRKMRQTDLLLLIIPSNNRKGVYSGKIFDYLASLTPILALVPTDDVAAELIIKCKAGYVADYINHNEIKKATLAAYNDWLNNKHLTANLNLIRKHHRKQQTKILEQLIEELSFQKR